MVAIREQYNLMARYNHDSRWKETCLAFEPSEGSNGVTSSVKNKIHIWVGLTKPPVNPNIDGFILLTRKQYLIVSSEVEVGCVLM